MGRKPFAINGRRKAGRGLLPKAAVIQCNWTLSRVPRSALHVPCFMICIQFPASAIGLPKFYYSGPWQQVAVRYRPAAVFGSWLRVSRSLSIMPNPASHVSRLTSRVLCPDAEQTQWLICKFFLEGALYFQVPERVVDRGGGVLSELFPPQKNSHTQKPLKNCGGSAPQHSALNPLPDLFLAS